MDINSLLSPAESPVKERSAPTPAAPTSASASATAPAPASIVQPNLGPSSPLRRQQRPSSGKRTASTLSNEITLDSIQSEAPPRSAPSLGYESIAQAQRNAFQPGYSAGTPTSEVRTPTGASPYAEMRSPFGTPQAQRPQLQYVGRRVSSASQMDTLADLAPNQHFQQARSGSVAEPHRSPSISRPNPPRTHSAISDLAMAEAPAQTPPPRAFVAPSVSEADQKTINELENYLSTNSYAYDSHVQLINLLHQGFIAHNQSSTGDSYENPADYSLLADLRQAREAMDSRFAVGEDIWKDWIHDEALLARTGEERMSVMELCQKATQEEPTSVALWLLYGEWVMHTHSEANGYAEAPADHWTEDDKAICQEVFTKDIVLDVWERAVEATKWRIDESNIVWDRYIDWVLQEFPENPPVHAVDQVNAMFMTRLQVPHATWAETSQKFWPIVSKHNAAHWEEVMAATNELAQEAKYQFSLREEHEFNIKRAAQAGDTAGLYQAFSDYLAWERKSETKSRRKSSFDLELKSALYERALLRFPTQSEWWLDYLGFLLRNAPQSPLMLPILERATRHCPWNGDLWARRILRSEVEHRPYEEVGNVKHKATNSGLLSIGGMEEILKVYSAWCNYLRRRAFDPDMTDDEVDIAEMGMNGTLEDASVAGKKIYGSEYKGDPLFRLEKIHVKFLTMARRYDDARAVFEGLVDTHKASTDFWERWYAFEMMCWAHERMGDNVRLETPESAPTMPTRVLKQALSQRDLDWPEKIIDLYANHCAMHETAEAVQMAETEVRTHRHFLQLRRAREAEEAAAAQPQPAPVRLETVLEESPAPGKRKRDEDVPVVSREGTKRNKTVDASDETISTEASESVSAQAKRDREHTTVSVLDLPSDVEERRIRTFFADCGKILSISVVKEDNAMTAKATIEFETEEDAKSAYTRDGKSFDGNSIHVQMGTRSTLWITNYPPEYDEARIRELFTAYGTILSVRFPSLKFNSRRVFCYVQFLTSEEAQAASAAMNNMQLDGKHRLTALISDPNAKKDRGGALSEGREVMARNIDRAVTEAGLRELFSPFGTVEHVKMLRKPVNNQFLGTAFITFSKAEEAQAATALNAKPHQGRVLQVEIAVKGGGKAAAAGAPTTTSSKFIRHGSAAPSDDGTSVGAGDETARRRASVVSASSEGTEKANTDHFDETTAFTKRERTVALIGLADTVSDARIESVMQKFGPLRKIITKRDRGGALVEFVNLSDSGKVGLGADVSALGAGVRVCEVGELLGKGGPRAELAQRPAKQPAFKPAAVMRPAQTSRPAQRGGRRGGLGSKASGFGNGASRAKSEVEEKGSAKTNADFKALFEKSREDATVASASASAASAPQPATVADDAMDVEQKQNGDADANA